MVTLQKHISHVALVRTVVRIERLVKNNKLKFEPNLSKRSIDSSFIRWNFARNAHFDRLLRHPATDRITREQKNVSTTSCG